MNVVRDPCSDSCHVMAPYKLSCYLLLLLLLEKVQCLAPLVGEDIGPVAC